MNDLHALHIVLEASVAKRGEVPLTNAHLLNIVKMARRLQRKSEEAHQTELVEIYNEVLGEEKKWGSN